MTNPTLFVGDIGTAIVLDVGHDISAATLRSIAVRKPDGTRTSWPAVAEGTTAMRFDTLAGTLDLAGEWKLNATVTTPSGSWTGNDLYMPVRAV